MNEQEFSHTVKHDGIAQLVECQALGHCGFESAVVLEVTLGGHSSGSLTIPRCKIGTWSRPGQLEVTLRIIMCKQEQRASTLVLKPMGRVSHSTKQRALAAP